MAIILIIVSFTDNSKWKKGSLIIRVVSMDDHKLFECYSCHARRPARSTSDLTNTTA